MTIRYKWLGSLALGWLALILGIRLWHAVSYREPVRDLRELKQVAQQHPEDHAFAELDEIGATLSPWEFEHVALQDLDQEELRAYYQDHQATLERFWAWYHAKGRQKLGPQADFPKASRIFIKDLEVPLSASFTETTHLLRLHRLLVTHAYFSYHQDQAERGKAALLASFELAHFFLQNPDTLQMMIGFAHLDVSQYVLAEQLPASALSSAFSPYLASRKLMVQTARKARWVDDAVGMTVMEDPFRYQDDSPDWQARFFAVVLGGYNVAHTQNMIYDAHQQYIEDVAQPLDQVDFQYYQLTEMPSWYSLNPVGRTLMAIGSPINNSFLRGNAFVVVRADVLRVRLALQEKNLPWQPAHVVQTLDELSLTSPYSHEPYRVNEQGDIVVFEAVDPRWRDVRRRYFGFGGLLGPDLHDPYQVLTDLDRERLSQQIPPTPFTETLVFRPPPEPVAAGETLLYEILSAPSAQLAGCFIEQGPMNATLSPTGVFEWQLGKSVSGVIPVNVSIVAHNGEVVHHQFEITVVNKQSNRSTRK
ncbi:hypothetical protein [Acanthopleuribacter pedis]|uniref:Uncharacterized protein n=1 Tax=Acanthopleuribacter pedis TaxID=442870 RepID=A0A8J7QH35_9BACT|nr:hypothetical protein [Acanthopleuribacter pedis]MBO1320045.1 hypothetical protein [Acanthopleuribacter pedis]